MSERLLARSHTQDYGTHTHQGGARVSNARLLLSTPFSVVLQLRVYYYSATASCLIVGLGKTRVPMDFFFTHWPQLKMGGKYVWLK